MHSPIPPAPGVPGAPAPLTRRRIDALDALRGFALCGILLVNIPQITGMIGYRVPGELLPAREVLDLSVQHRFFPLFSFLFGLSFVLFFESAAAKTASPRLVLLRRLLALGVLGAGHQLLHPGEALTPYAVFGLLVLLPSTWLPRPAVLAAGLLATVAGVTLAGGGMAVIPGLFLLGSATARYGVADTLEGRGRQIAVLFAVSAPAAVAATLWQHHTWLDAVATRSAAIAGLLAATAYVCGFLLLLRGPLGRALESVFAPLGRLALTNYVGATLIVVSLAPVLGLDGSRRWTAALLLAAAILVLQVIVGRVWLKSFRYGPLEWAWRCVTWWEFVPIRRSGRGRGAGAGGGAHRATAGRVGGGRFSGGRVSGV
ncbi:DUF418 domain-containing protein [Streptomyces sp. NBC_01298]|uniref:DUF418 domain-containing protein n=1 Tax=Streptomyces sp. NBC_01298 TaxID=2903817 RepID=UPI002E10E575|nr:DUF418 domain-containing protein [Streptomyces sp. NBC_01298]